MDVVVDNGPRRLCSRLDDCQYGNSVVNVVVLVVVGWVHDGAKKKLCLWRHYL